MRETERERERETERERERKREREKERDAFKNICEALTKSEKKFLLSGQIKREAVTRRKEKNVTHPHTRCDFDANKRGREKKHANENSQGLFFAGK